MELGTGIAEDILQKSGAPVVLPTGALASDQNDLILKPLNLTYSLVKELSRFTRHPARLCRDEHSVSTKPPAECG